MIRFAMALFALIATPAWSKVMMTSMDSIGRSQVPVTIIVPDKGKVKGLILFSHGAFSSPAKYAELTGPWSKRGYAIIAPLHADSSDWSGAKPEMKDQTVWRKADMANVIARLPEFAKLGGFGLRKQPFIAAGHSFGALIAMELDDPRIVSIVAFSPPGPVPGLSLPIVSKPMFTVTGTADSHPIMAPKWEAHLTAHNKSEWVSWAYVGNGADHYFGGIYCRPELPGPKQWEPFWEALQLSQAFMDASIQFPVGKSESAPVTSVRAAANEAARAAKAMVNLYKALDGVPTKAGTLSRNSSGPSPFGKGGSRN
jgi:dienelactone hydrolase